MIDHYLSYSQLKKHCKYKELEGRGISENDIRELIKNQLAKIKSETFEYNIIKRGSHFVVENFAQVLLLRKINDRLRRVYKDKQSSRDQIIEQIIVLLEESCPFYILKTDIESFYESVIPENIVNKIVKDNIVSYYMQLLINDLFEHKLITKHPGLPRGISISSTLSEIYMRYFDKKCVGYNGNYFYARYVDDIIIFSHDKNMLKEFKNKIDSILPQGLYHNKSKTSILNGKRINKYKPLEFLGYKFTTSDTKNSKQVEVSIADTKVKKIKTRLVKTFLSFLSNESYQLLKRRLKFLTSNYCLRRDREGNKLKAGVYYNYKYVNNLMQMKEIDLFYRKLLYSKNSSFGNKLNNSLTSRQKEELSKYSFKFGFENKIMYSFLPSELRKITSCWK